MYSPYTDGAVQGIGSWSGRGAEAVTGQAKIVGDDPLNLKVYSLGIYPGSAKPYRGRYPCGSLVYNGIWYYGTYCLDEPYGPCGNWCIQGPFVGFRISRDYGRTWLTGEPTPEDNLFWETAQEGAKVKMGAPHFVDFGKNMEHSPDGKAYMVAHGVTRSEANHTWVSGDEVYLARVRPSPANINDATKYEFFAGRDVKGRPIWTGDFKLIKPLFAWPDNAGCVTMTYNAPLKKYLMCVTYGWPPVGTMDTYILESDRITGRWKLVTYMHKFGEQAYFVNIPSKFISSDGQTAWLCFSANWKKHHKVNPPGGGYGLGLHEITLRVCKGDPARKHK
jgi:hypothetical protein